jgi:SPP1 gp7 family putative phage head morphogenesis protein
MALTGQEIEQILKGIYNDTITLLDLPGNLYLDTGKTILNKIYQGYGGNLEDFIPGSSEYVMLEKLYESNYRFAAAKTFQNVRAIQPLVFENGIRRAFEEFSKDAEQVYKLYNKTWLKTEKNTALVSADSARYWQEIEADKEIFPYLKYETVNDEAVRDEHAALDGITRRIDDSFWSWAMPPNGYGCRCIATQLTKEEAKETPKSKIPNKNKEVPKLFQNNSGKTGQIFKETGSGKHPYYKVPKKYKGLKENNFNLGIPAR